MTKLQLCPFGTAGSVTVFTVANVDTAESKPKLKSTLFRISLSFWLNIISTKTNDYIADVFEMKYRSFAN